MIIKSLDISDYRNYDRMCLALHEGTNIFYGDNAQGKTNILEAAYVSGTTKSHKGSKDKERRYGHPFFNTSAWKRKDSIQCSKQAL